MKKIQYYIYEIDNWFEWHSPIYISVYLFTILSEWWKCRDIFKFPAIEVYKEEVKVEDKYELFCIDARGLMWEWEWNEIRFEECPRIYITLFDKWRYRIVFTSPYHNYRGWRNNYLYWGCILEYLYMYDKDFVKTYENNEWTRFESCEVDGERYHVNVPIWDWNMIKTKAIKKYARDLSPKTVEIIKRKEF